jgi:preprotein translocase subunit SecG
MYIVVTFIHVIACIVLVLVVLLQAGKGADMGAVFGGASSTIFGSSGAGNFLTRLTTGAAIVFMITSLTLTYGSSHSTSSTIMPESSVAPVEESAPSGPGAAANEAGDEEAADVATGAEPAEQEAAPAPAPEAAKPAGDAGAPKEPAAP